MKKSESIKEIAQAMCKASEEIKNIQKNNTANMGNYSCKYADLPHILDNVKPILTKNNLIVVQDAFRAEEGYLDIRTLFMHVSGEWIETTVTVPTTSNNPNKAQAAGSAITYGRRYGLSALLNISSEEDKDASDLTNDKNNIDFDEVKEKLKNMTVKESIEYFNKLQPSCVSQAQEKALKAIFAMHKKEIEQ